MSICRSIRRWKRSNEFHSLFLMQKNTLIRRCWRLNERVGEALSLSSDRFTDLLQGSDVLQTKQQAAAVLAFSVALVAGKPLEHVSYQWFLTRFDEFLYWDRVVVGSAWQRRGLGRALFESLRGEAQARGLHSMVCQVHERPPNPAAHAFVQSLGFTAIESVMLPSREIVTMYQRSTARATP